MGTLQEFSGIRFTDRKGRCPLAFQDLAFHFREACHIARHVLVWGRNEWNMFLYCQIDGLLRWIFWRPQR